MKKIQQSILLAGMMASGKSTVGKLLAKKLHLPFWDTDQEVEKSRGKSINQIFAKEGEAAFRRYELEAIEACLAKGPAVLALGGGAVCSKAKLKKLSQAGSLILLKAKPANLIKRLQDDQSRPLLKGDLEKKLSKLLAKRESFYQSIPFKVVTDDRSPDELAKEISQRLISEKSALWVGLGKRSYPLYFLKNSAKLLPWILKAHLPSKKLVLVTHRLLDSMYGKNYLKALSKDFEVSKIILPDGEQHKNLATMEKLYTQLVKVGADRETTLIALGGGVLGDMVGFAAATYLRGVPFVQIPSTLLAQVDSSIGGKTGVDLPQGKNLVGAFYQPKLVIMDETLLKTLPKREFVAGLAEVIKYAAIFDGELFQNLQKRMKSILATPGKGMEDIIRRSCEWKAYVVEKDEEERSGLRSLLNFGHSLGHAIESLSSYAKYRHGEAVAIGMIYAAKLSSHRFGFPQKSLEALVNLIKSAGLPVDFPKYSHAQYLNALKQDKKRLSDQINFVYLKKIGQAFTQKTDLSEVLQIL
ncbi:MAG: 3-dehydroquinate synthase [Deltaproteobacteria bacterium]|nr:3-dehydroquinate synthase [Deltaproteobacteria bacterium]